MACQIYMVAGSSLKSGMSASSGRSNMDTIGMRNLGKGDRVFAQAHHGVGQCDVKGKVVGACGDLGMIV